MKHTLTVLTLALTLVLALAPTLNLALGGESVPRHASPVLEPTETIGAFRPGPGSNEMLRAPIAAADGLEVIISDVVIPPGAEVPRHFHPGEEFVYVIEGWAVHVEEGQPDRILKAGQSYVIPPRAKHAPRGGPEGARAIVFRVHVEGLPERIPAPE